MSTWSERIRDLQRVGMTLEQIGEKVGLAVSTLSDLANERSKSPRGDAAIQLHTLHEQKCGTKRPRAAAG